MGMFCRKEASKWPFPSLHEDLNDAAEEAGTLRSTACGLWERLAAEQSASQGLQEELAWLQRELEQLKVCGKELGEAKMARTLREEAQQQQQQQQQPPERGSAAWLEVAAELCGGRPSQSKTQATTPPVFPRETRGQSRRSYEDVDLTSVRNQLLSCGGFLTGTV